MKLRLALGVGALALLILGLVAWGSSTQRSIEGAIVAIGAEALPIAVDGGDDVATLMLCTPAGTWPAQRRDLDGAVLVHVLRFTHVLDARGRFLASASRFENLRPGQRVEVWTTDETLQSWPPQVYAVKIEIAGDAPSSDAPCHWQE